MTKVRAVLIHFSHAWQWPAVAVSAIWGMCLIFGGWLYRPFDPSLGLNHVAETVQGWFGLALLLGALMVTAASIVRHGNVFLAYLLERSGIMLMAVFWFILAAGFLYLSPGKPLPYVSSLGWGAGAAIRFYQASHEKNGTADNVEDKRCRRSEDG